MSARRRPDLSGKRLLIVTGKGGVGKSTVAAALAITASGRGLRTIVAEVAARSDVASLLGGSGTAPAREVELAPALHHVSIEPQGALAEYIRDEVPGRVPGLILARSRAFDVLATATPGMRELLTVGKVWELAQRPRRTPGARPYDLVILDAPASGHAAALLGAPRTFASIANVGPVARQGAAIDRMLRDGRAGAAHRPRGRLPGDLLARAQGRGGGDLLRRSARHGRHAPLRGDRQPGAPARARDGRYGRYHHAANSGARRPAGREGRPDSRGGAAARAQGCGGR